MWRTLFLKLLLPVSGATAFFVFLAAFALYEDASVGLLVAGALGIGLAAGSLVALGVTIANRALGGAAQAGETGGVQQEQEVQLGIPASAAFELAYTSITSVRTALVKQHDRAAGVIEARTDNTLGPSSRITIRISEREEGCTVRVESRPESVWTLIDYGRNADHVRRIVAWIRHRAK